MQEFINVTINETNCLIRCYKGKGTGLGKTLRFYYLPILRLSLSESNVILPPVEKDGHYSANFFPFWVNFSVAKYFVLSHIT